MIFIIPRCGILYDSTEPILYLRDPELIKQVTIRDFDSFENFGYVPGKSGELAANRIGFFNTTGGEWRALRHVTTPALMSKNNRHFAHKISGCVTEIREVLEKNAGKPINLEDYIYTYTMDCLGKACFSLDFGTTVNGGSVILDKSMSLFRTWRFVLTSMAPTLCYYLNISIWNLESVRYLFKFTEKIVAEREAMSESSTDDFVDSMLRTKNEEAAEGTRQATDAKYLTNKLISSAMITFCLDAVDTIGTNICMACHFLAVNPEVQEKALAEVDRVAAMDLADEEVVDELNYLDNVFTETTRLAAFPYSLRTCTKDWPLPGHPGVVIPKGMRVQYATLGIHYDPEYYDDPMKFDPDRFTSENKGKIATGTFFGFGIGPRQCLGSKLSRVEAKLFLYSLLRRCRLEPNEKTQRTLNWRKDTFSRLEGGTWITLVSRN